MEIDSSESENSLPEFLTLPHSSSKAHAFCIESIKQGEKDAVAQAAGKVTEKYLSPTCTVFNTVYSLAQRCIPFSDFEDEIELLIKNGVDVGTGLHSRQTAVKIVDFIAKEIRKKICTKIIEKDLKICLIVDEDSTLSCKPVLILFLEVEGSVTSPTIFVELVELEKQDAETIFSSVMGSLNNVGFTKKYMKKNLIGFRANGASIMLGRKSGVSARIAKEFPNIMKDSNEYAIPDSVQKAKNTARTIVVNSTEAERGFSEMDLRCSEKRNRLTVSNIANIMTVSLTGLPIKDWDPIPTVKKWLRTHHTALDVQVKLEESESEEEANQTAIWEYLK